jgi:hypothetical protein
MVILDAVVVGRDSCLLSLQNPLRELVVFQSPGEDDPAPSQSAQESVPVAGKPPSATCSGLAELASLVPQGSSLKAPQYLLFVPGSDRFSIPKVDVHGGPPLKARDT